MKKNIVFLGAPGVGKGTFASRVSKALNIPAISTGDLLRSEIKQKSELGLQIQVILTIGSVHFKRVFPRNSRTREI
jgi:adenylate kinase